MLDRSRRRRGGSRIRDSWIPLTLVLLAIVALLAIAASRTDRDRAGAAVEPDTAEERTGTVRAKPRDDGFVGEAIGLLRDSVDTRMRTIA